MDGHFWYFLCSNTAFLWKHDEVILGGTVTVYSEKKPLSLTPPSCHSTFMTSVEGGILKNLVEFTFLSHECINHGNWRFDASKSEFIQYILPLKICSVSLFFVCGNYYFYLTEVHQKLQYIHLQYVTKDFCFK